MISSDSTPALLLSFHIVDLGPGRGYQAEGLQTHGRLRPLELEELPMKGGALCSLASRLLS